MASIRQQIWTAEPGHGAKQPDGPASRPFASMGRKMMSEMRRADVVEKEMKKADTALLSSSFYRRC